MKRNERINSIESSLLSMTKLLLLIFISFLTISCKDKTAHKTTETGDSQDIINISFDEFESNVDQYRGKYVKVEGMCVRIDERGGGSMYIVGRDPHFEIKVTAGKDVVRFSRYFEGRTMEVYGYVRHEDRTYTQTTTPESSDEHKEIYRYPPSRYYVECDKYRRIDTRTR